MTTIAHLTDLHFGSEAPGSVPVLLEELARHRFDLIALSGDLTMAARRHEFERARAFLAELRVPWLAVPGNHDITPYKLWERFVNPFGRWRSHVSAVLEPRWRNHRVMVQGINTARSAGLYLDWSRGRFGRGQIRHVKEAVAALNPQETLVVVAHHPVAFGSDLAQRYHLAARAEDLLQTISRGPRSIVLAGHRHAAHVSLWNARTGERQIAEGAGVGTSDVLLVHAGTALSQRLRGEGNSYQILTLEEAAIGVETRLLTAEGWTTSRKLHLHFSPDMAESLARPAAA